MTDFWICSTCGVEHSGRPLACAICADERQYLPADGQQWTTLDGLRAADATVQFTELEPRLWGLEVTPAVVGIGQQAKLLVTEVGSLLWDPVAYLDEAAVARVRELAGPAGVTAIVASHPHMFGVQLEWSRRLGDVPVMVSRSDAAWIARPGDAIQLWDGEPELLPGVTLSQPGGHFPGAAIVHWTAGAGGRGVLLGADTIAPNPDRRSVAFMRSYPNRIPLSAAVVERIAAHVEPLVFDRIYNNFTQVVPSDGHAAVQWSARRHAAWVRGDHDDLT